MSNESNYCFDPRKFKKNYINYLKNVASQSNSNELESSDVKNPIDIKRSQRQNNSNSDWRSCNTEIVNSKQIFSSGDIELYKEYVQWEFIKNELYKKGESLLNIVTDIDKQEFTNTLQRWIIFINEDFNDVPKYEYYTILPNIELEHSGAQFLRTTIIEKKFVNEEDADAKIREILNFISENHSQVIRHELSKPLQVEHDRDQNIVVVNEFISEEVPCINLLVTRGGVIATAQMLLHYESFGKQYRLIDPGEVDKIMLESFNVCNEESKSLECQLQQENNELEWRRRKNKNDNNEEVLLSKNINMYKNPKWNKQRNNKIQNNCNLREGQEWRRSNNNNRMKESTKVTLLSGDIELYKEYVQWDFINNELYKKGESLLNIKTNKEKEEFTNTLQMWIIFINEDFNDVPKYEYYTILPNIELEHSGAQFLRTAIIKKKFVNEEDADVKIREILNFISENHSQVIRHELSKPLQVEHDRDKNIVVVNEYKSKKIPRVNLLVSKSGVLATARMLLRYESFGNGSYQWGDPKEVHKVLHDKFNVRYEGFASPLTSRYIEYSEAHFCSLFPETDGVFGSLGNFFHVDMKQHPGGWSLNPPFLNVIMKNLADKIIKTLDDGHECYFFCTFPCWKDDEGWKILNNSDHLLMRFDLYPHHFIIQDAYGRKFMPNMAKNLFVIGKLPPTYANLIELHKVLKVKPKNYQLLKNCP